MTRKTRAVPFFGLDREFSAYENSYTEIAHRILSHGKVLQGKEVSKLENKVADFCDRSYGVAVNSCTDALFFSLKAAGVQPGDEILVTDFSFIASASPILRIGAKPVFIDVDDNYNMDLTLAKSMISSKTKAIIFVHLYGQIGDPDEIEDFATFHNLVLIEDAAQAFGASYRGRKAGSLGLLSCLSFDPTKAIGAPGSGGMILIDDESLSQKISSLRYHGKNEKGEFEFLGYNSQMPTLTAAILDYKINQNEKWLARRQEIADFYISNISEKYICPVEIKGSAHTYHKFVIRSKKRDRLREFLSQHNIQTMIHYPKPLHQQPCFKSFDYEDINYPMVMSISREVLSLPIHPFLTDEEVEFVVEKVNRFKG